MAKDRPNADIDRELEDLPRDLDDLDQVPEDADLFAVHAADGTPMALVDGRDEAFAAAIQDNTK